MNCLTGELSPRRSSLLPEGKKGKILWLSLLREGIVMFSFLLLRACFSFLYFAIIPRYVTFNIFIFLIIKSIHLRNVVYILSDEQNLLPYQDYMNVQLFPQVEILLLVLKVEVPLKDVLYIGAI